MWILKLIFSLVSELQSKGFEIDGLVSAKDRITVFEFYKDNIKYNISIDPVKEEQGEYLKLTGFMKKENVGIAECQVEPVVKELKPEDNLNVYYKEGNGFSAILTKNFNLKFSMEGIDKDATDALAKDIIGSIVNP